MSKPFLNPNFDKKHFLEKKWGKAPFFLPSLVSFNDLISAEELSGLACEEFIESRLITNDKEFSLRHGPFLEKEFMELPNSNWTLLVQSVDLYLEEIKNLKELFNFLPNWLLEDVMISYATPGGGVGPHFDHYDVFLIQGQGQRRWRVGQKCDIDTPIDDSSGLELLSNLKASQEFLLNQGDVLYIPPNFAHWGESIDESICFSIGFRAPSESEMLEGFGLMVASKTSAFNRFISKPRGPLLKGHGKIDDADLRSAFTMIQSRLSDYGEFCQWFGSFMTSPKYPELFEEIDNGINFSQIMAAQKLGTLALNPISRLAYCELPDREQMLLFADGKSYKLSMSNINLISDICDLNLCINELLKDYEISEEVSKVLVDLFKRGAIQILDN